MTVTTMSAEDYAAQLIRDAHACSEAVQPKAIAQQSGLSVAEVNVLIDQVVAERLNRHGRPGRKRSDVGHKPDLQEVAEVVRSAGGKMPPAQAVMAGFGVGQSYAYRLVSEARKAGLLSAEDVAPRRPGPKPTPVPVEPVAAPVAVVEPVPAEEPLATPEPEPVAVLDVTDEVAAIVSAMLESPAQILVVDIPDPDPVVEWEDSDEVQEVSLLGYQEALGKLAGHPSKRIGDAAVRASVALGLLMQELDRTGELEARRERLLAQLAEVEAELAGVA